MRRYHLIASALTLFVSGAQGENNATALDCGWFSFVSATPTNVTLKTPSSGGVARYIMVSGSDLEGYKSGYNEEFTIPLDKEVTFSDGWHVRAIYTPILTRQLLKGFQQKLLVDNRLGGWSTDNIAYIAMSDNIPIKVEADDVEIILDGGGLFFDQDNRQWKNMPWEWKRFEKPQTAIAPETVKDKPPGPVPPPVVEPPPAVTSEPPPITEDGNAAADESEAAASPPSRLWFCLGGILLAFCAAFYFVWRKTEN